MSPNIYIYSILYFLVFVQINTIYYRAGVYFCYKHTIFLWVQLIALRNRETGAEYGGGNNNINLNNADTKSYWSNNGSDISSDINLGTSRISTPQTSFNNITITQLLINQNSSSNHNNNDSNKPELDLIQCPKLDPPSIQEDSFCTMFGAGGGAGANAGVDQTQTTAFWAWPEQQHLN